MVGSGPLEDKEEENRRKAIEKSLKEAEEEARKKAEEDALKKAEAEVERDTTRYFMDFFKEEIDFVPMEETNIERVPVWSFGFILTTKSIYQQ